MINISDNTLSTLLSSVNEVLEHQREKEILRGENFNIFTVMGMETNENKTHSTMIGTLLNPQGAHLKGPTFLRLFLEVIDSKDLDPETTEVELERYAGPIDWKEKTGGRLDIFLQDSLGNCLSIENKIHAPDQKAQLQRYCNYRKGFNKVFYLNLEGNEPSVESIGELEVEKNFHIISYKKEVLIWLELCLKEAADAPILRETIKQYIILIKKLTTTIDVAEERKLTTLLLKQHKAAAYIAANYEKARRNVADQIRQNLVTGLQEILGVDYVVSSSRDISSPWAKIWIEATGVTTEKVKLGIENFNEKGHLNGNLFLGVFTKVHVEIPYWEFRQSEKINKWWANPAQLTFDKKKINFGDMELISRLYDDEQYRNRFLAETLKQIKSFVDEEIAYISKYLARESAMKQE